MKLVLFLSLFLVAAAYALPATNPLTSVNQPKGYSYDLSPYRPPATLSQIFLALLNAARNWFSDLILLILGITAGDLIKQISIVMVGMDLLVEEAVTELEQIIVKVVREIQKELQEIINEALEQALEIMAPILAQLREIIPYMPASRSIETRDFVSDVIEALLGISLQELLANINNVLLELNVLLNATFVSLAKVANNVSAEIAAEIEFVITNTLEQAVDLLKPLMSTLGQLPITYRLPKPALFPTMDRFPIVDRAGKLRAA